MQEAAFQILAFVDSYSQQPRFQVAVVGKVHRFRVQKQENVLRYIFCFGKAAAAGICRAQYRIAKGAERIQRDVFFIIHSQPPSVMKCIIIYINT